MTQTDSRPTRSFTLPYEQPRYYDPQPAEPRIERTLPERTLVERTLVETPAGDPLRRRRYGLLAGWSLLWFLIFNRHGGYSWHYFVQGSTLLFDGAGPGQPAGGLHVYANYPQLQIGPFTFAVAQVLRQFGGLGGRLFAELVMTALGLVVLFVVERIAVAVRPELLSGGRSDSRLHRTMLIGGAAFLIGWTDLGAAYGHLDDVLALLCVALCVWAVVSDLPAIAGICLGLSVDAKPWALVFLPLILAVPKRIRRHAALWAAATIVIAWLPFVLADLHTLTATQFTIVNEPSSSLRALGVTAPSTPGWDRAAQIALGCLLGALAVYRRRWPAVILLGVGARIALDPGVYGYYTAGVLLGALLWDLLGLRRSAPIWTLVSGAALAVAPVLISDTALLGDLRLWLVLAFTLALLLAPSPGYLIPDRLGRRRAG